jgi:hypothetical protein
VSVDRARKAKSRPPYEVIQPKWLMGHTWNHLGAALRRDIELSVASGYDFLKSPVERRLTVDELLLEVGASLISTAVRELRSERSRVEPEPASK